MDLLKQTKVYVETFGCQMNVSDSERVAGDLSARGYQIVAQEKDADVVLFNTCSIREKAEQKLYTRVGEVRFGRRAEQQPLIGVMGCVAQLEGENLLDKNQNKIDFVVGTQATGRVSEIIARRQIGRTSPTVDVGEREADYDWTTVSAHRHSPFVAFVPIIEGCNKFCTYCIVPFSRGRERSRAAVDIIREIRQLRAEGVREIHLIGQNVNSYRPRNLAGLEGFAGATPFVKLLRATAATGIERIKFTTSFPRDFHTDIVSAINAHENLCNWVHLPVQSGSDRILRQMRRGHTVDAYLRHIESLKNSPRRIAVTSDIIVGFPGETEADAAATRNLIEQCEFAALYLFKYSARPGTPAAALPDALPEDEKQARFIELETAQKKAQAKVWQQHLGQVEKVLAERVSSKSEKDLSGHTTCHKTVNFTAGRDGIGQIHQIRITQVKPNSLYGEVVC